MRLLKLEEDVREMVISGDISEGHARTLLSLPTAESQKLIADRIVKEKLSVRDTEKLVKKLVSDVKRPVKKRDYEKEAILNNLSEQLKDIFGTKVSISENAKHRGKIEIEYYSDDELNRIFELLQSIR
jgi:ParB family chromosome partitioning protein